MTGSSPTRAAGTRAPPKGKAERHEAHANLSAELESQAGAWDHARLLRHYLRVLSRTAGEGQIRATLGEEKVDFLLWAEQCAAQLDPLSATPPNPDRQRDRPHSGDQVHKDLLVRFLGCDSQPSWKLNSEVSAVDADSEELAATLEQLKRGSNLLNRRVHTGGNHRLSLLVGSLCTRRNRRWRHLRQLLELRQYREQIGFRTESIVTPQRIAGCQMTLDRLNAS